MGGNCRLCGNKIDDIFNDHGEIKDGGPCPWFGEHIDGEGNKIVVTALTEEQIIKYNSEMFGETRTNKKHDAFCTGRRSRFRKQLVAGQWIYPKGAGRGNNRMPKKIVEMSRMQRIIRWFSSMVGREPKDGFLYLKSGRSYIDLEDGGWDYPVCEQWKRGYAFDITTGQEHQEIIADEFYWKRILPNTQRGGMVPYFGYANVFVGRLLHKGSKDHAWKWYQKRSTDPCPECNGKFIVLEDITSKYVCERCGYPIEDSNIASDYSPNAHIIPEGKDVAGHTQDNFTERTVEVKNRIYARSQCDWMRGLEGDRINEISDKIHKAASTFKNISKDFAAERAAEVKGQLEKNRLEISQGSQKVSKGEKSKKEGDPDGDGVHQNAKAWDKKQADRMEAAVNNIPIIFKMEESAYVRLRWSEGPLKGKNAVNGWEKMTREVADGLLDGHIEYEKYWIKDHGWMLVAQGFTDEIGESLIRVANELVDKNEWDDSGRIFASFVGGVNNPKYLEFVSSIMICSTAEDGDSDEVIIQNKYLRELHEGMLGTEAIQDPKRRMNLSKTPKYSSGYNSKELNDSLEFEWNYMSILAVVTMVQMYFLFFENKTVRWK